MCRRRRKSSAAGVVVVGRRRLGELPEPAGGDPARPDHSPTATVRSRVDPGEVDVGVDGAEGGTEGGQDD